MNNSLLINQNLLLEKIEKFYNRFYMNKLLKGGLLTIGLTLSLFLVVDLAEYYGNFNSGIRFVLFYGLVASILGGLFYGIGIPLSKLFHLSKGLTPEQAAVLIGENLPSVSDKLLNALQISKLDQLDNALVRAALLQKTQELKEVSYEQAVNLKVNKKYVPYAAIPVAVLVGILLIQPEVVTKSAQRIYQHEIPYDKIAPFDFLLSSSKTEAVQGEDITLQLKLRGQIIPADARIIIGSNSFQMRKIGEGLFEYKLYAVKEDVVLQCEADGYFSEQLNLAVRPKPQWLEMKLMAHYPGYLNKKNEVWNNVDKVVVPEGTELVWSLKGKNIDVAAFCISGNCETMDKKANIFSIKRTVSSAFSYQISTKNNWVSDTLLPYQVEVIKDEYPAIAVETQADTSLQRMQYITGRIRDDHGFYGLQAHLSIGDSSWTEKLDVNRQLKEGMFFYQLNLASLNLAKGVSVRVYFSVRDNDALHGYKETKSRKLTFQQPSDKEVADAINKSADKLEDKLNENIDLAKSLDKDIKKLNKELFDKKKMDWRDREKLENVMNKQKQLEKNVEDIEKQMNEVRQIQNEYRPPSPELLEKQNQLNELFEKLMDEETKALFEEMERLMEEMNKEAIQEQLKKIELSNEDIEEALDRNLELFKQMEFVADMEKALEKLDELAKEQEKLAEDTKEKNDSNEQLKERQEELSKEFEDLKKELERLEKKNEELEDPNTIDFEKESGEEVSKKQESAKDNLDKKKSKKASEDQKEAAEKMQDMKERMQMSMDMNSSQQSMEDLNALRAIMENLLRLSFEEEDLMVALSETKKEDPNVQKINARQLELLENARIVKDSLYALSRRVPQLDPVINKELKNIDYQINSAMSNLNNRDLAKARMHQQNALTSINILAVMLDEVIQQMQQQMQSKNSGKGQCKKPGSGKPGKPSMQQAKSMQQQLNKQIEAMKKQLEKGNNKGKKPGEKNPGGQGQNSMQLAKMAAKQAMIRNELGKMAEQLDKEGALQESKELKKMADMMEKTEEDIVNKQLTNEMLRRQQEIMTRMLKAENAMREREYDNKRESHEAQQQKEEEDDKAFLEFKKQREAEVEMLRMVPLGINDYFKDKVGTYMLDVSNR